jgi:hypothetical protein
MVIARIAGLRRARLIALGLLSAVAALLALGLPRAGAADLEVRSFNVLVDGKKAGDYQMTIGRQADGSVSMSAQSDVRVTVLGVSVYTYTYRGMEMWKDGRLQRLETGGKEKGKAFAVRAAVDGANVRVRFIEEGKPATERLTRPDVWTTSIWHLPPAQFRNNKVLLLGCDNGKDIQGSLQLVGTEQISVAGQTMTCSHYRVMKDVPHDVWYDAQERLVRDVWTASGHRTVVEMTGVRR